MRGAPPPLMFPIEGSGMTVPQYSNTDRSCAAGATPIDGYSCFYSPGFQGEQFPAARCVDPSIQTLDANSRPDTSAMQSLVANPSSTGNLHGVLGSESSMGVLWGQACQWNQAQISMQQGRKLDSGNQGEFNFPRGRGLSVSQGNAPGPIPSIEGRYQRSDVGGVDDPCRGLPSASHWAAHNGSFYPVAQQQQHPISTVSSEASRASSTGVLETGKGGQSTLQSPTQSSKGQLHHEIVAFAQQCFPSGEELLLMEQALTQLEMVASEEFVGSKTILFGSQASALSLPGSDMDVVILGAGRDICAPAEQFTPGEKTAVVAKLQRLLEALRQRGLVEGKGRLLAHARVPIVKVLLRLGTKSMSVDISMGVKNGAAAVELIQRHVMARGPVRPLVVVLKAILKNRDLNEVFTGGISSYVLFNMVVSHLVMEGVDFQVKEDAPLLSSVSRQIEFLKRSLENMEYDLGTLLLGFLKRFGVHFQYDTLAVSIRNGAVTLKSTLAYRGNSSSILAVEDPQAPGKDICGGSNRMHKVKEAFQKVAEKLELANGGLRNGKAQAQDYPLLNRVFTVGAVLKRRLIRIRKSDSGVNLGEGKKSSKRPVQGVGFQDLSNGTKRRKSRVG